MFNVLSRLSKQERRQLHFCEEVPQILHQNRSSFKIYDLSKTKISKDMRKTSMFLQYIVLLYYKTNGIAALLSLGYLSPNLRMYHW